MDCRGSMLSRHAPSFRLSAADMNNVAAFDHGLLMSCI